MNNNDFFNEGDNLNNNSIPKSMPTTSTDRLNPTNNVFTTNDNINGQLNNQNINTNSNFSQQGNYTQVPKEMVSQQPNINLVGNLNNQSSNVYTSTSSMSSTSTDKLNPTNNVFTTNDNINGQLNNQNINTNSNFSQQGNYTQVPKEMVSQQPNINLVGNLNNQSSNVYTSTSSMSSTSTDKLNPTNNVFTTNDNINGQLNNQNINTNSNFSQQGNYTQVPKETISQQPNINLVGGQNGNSNTVDIIGPQINSINSMSQQNVEYKSNINDEELLRAFIGNNYDKITTKPFNFAGFFFTMFYMFYRKMFLYGIILFLINLIVFSFVNNFIVSIIFGLVVGFLVNKIYIYYANKKIAKIKFQNPQKSIDELKNLCLIQGGTSVGQIFLGLLAELGIAFVISLIIIVTGLGNIISFFNLDNWSKLINGFNIGINENNKSQKSILTENVVIKDYVCIQSNCNISVEDASGTIDYKFDAENADLFDLLKDYSDYIKVNIYYTQENDSRTIVDYKIYLKSNNEDISDVKTEEDLRAKIGLYTTGVYTETFTLSEIGTTGFGFDDDKSYTFSNYTFVDDNNNKYEMKYMDSNGKINLVKGKKYNVTFEVAAGVFEYEFNIKSVK